MVQINAQEEAYPGDESIWGYFINVEARHKSLRADLLVIHVESLLSSVDSRRSFAELR